jgi:putative NIF3 family GTP cyclohydrolase 1 type 2
MAGMAHPRTSRGCVTRRDFLTAAIAAASMPSMIGQASRVQTAAQVTDRIRAAFGPTWRVTPTDAFHAGRPDVVVRGIATTVMSTLDVLHRAAKAGRNLVITHEPTFYTGNDNVMDLTDDPMYRRKVAFIEANDLAIFRFHDNWHTRRPEPMGQGLAESLGWGDRRSADEPDVFVIAPTTVRDVVKRIEDRLNVRSYRVIGSPATRVRRVGFLPGTPPGATAASRLLPRVDLVIAGEQREWEGVYYAFDTVAAGEPKAMITLGHAVSEDPGMKLCADWLRTFITDLPVEWIPAGEPFTKL